MQTKTQALQDLLERQGQPPRVAPLLPLMMVVSVVLLVHIHDRREQQVLAWALQLLKQSLFFLQVAAG